MFRKILVPVDLTDTHARSIQIAGDLALAGEGEVTLIHAIELIAGVDMEEEKEFYDRLEQSARQHMERLGKDLGARKVSWKSKVVYGPRAQEIVSYVGEAESDLILLTSHRIDLEAPGSGWGSLSYKIGILSPCPVLLVK